MTRRAITALIATCLYVMPVAAADTNVGTVMPIDAVAIDAGRAAEEAEFATAPHIDVVVDVHGSPGARPAPLTGLYAGFALAQGFDAYSTLQAIKQGASEANPLMKGAAAHPALLLAVKSGLTVGTIYSSERLWRHHRRGAAIALMAVTTALQVGIDIHNASVLHAQH